MATSQLLEKKKSEFPSFNFQRVSRFSKIIDVDLWFFNVCKKIAEKIREKNICKVLFSKLYIILTIPRIVRRVVDSIITWQISDPPPLHTHRYFWTSYTHTHTQTQTHTHTSYPHQVCPFNCPDVQGYSQKITEAYKGNSAHRSIFS